MNIKFFCKRKVEFLLPESEHETHMWDEGGEKGVSL